MKLNPKAYGPALRTPILRNLTGRVGHRAGGSTGRANVHSKRGALKQPKPPQRKG